MAITIDDSLLISGSVENLAWSNKPVSVLDASVLPNDFSGQGGPITSREFEVMSYCDSQLIWPSPFTYIALMQEFGYDI